MNIQANKMHFNKNYKSLSRLLIALFAILALGSGIATVWAAPNAAVLTLSQKVGDSEPLLGGTISYDIVLGNSGTDPVTDKGYNVTISNTLPVSITFVSATINPTQIKTNDTGSTVLIWDNIADLEVNEQLELSIIGSIDPAISLSDSLTNTVVARMNEAPDNSLSWQKEVDSNVAALQALEIEAKAIQSTADEQATGAGEYDGSADWPYKYQATVQNNNVASTEDVVATIKLPAGVAYMGGATISPNPNGSSATPVLALNDDGSLTLEWSLGTLTTAQYASPVVITFDTAIPYRFRTANNTLAASGPFAGPMSGTIIPEDALMEVTYEATGLYAGNPTADGTMSTPDDDKTVKVTAEYLTIAKSASPGIVGIGESVTFNINYYVSEYYTTTNVIITDILPDGMTFDSSSLFPSNIEENTPGTGETRLTFDIPTTKTTPGNSGTVVITATVDTTYDRAPYTNEPIVSGDSLTNQAVLANDWQDIIDPARAAVGNPDTSNATVQTRKPTLAKDVKDPNTGNWGDHSYGFTGDTIYFRIQFDQAADVDGKEVVIRDFLPRGMTFDASTDSYTSSGTFSDSGSCSTNPSSPTVGDLNGLQFLEWRLCNVDQGSTWEGIFGATLGATPDLEAGWIVGNFGKLSYQNTYADGYSERDFATVDYDAPNLVLTKSATPESGLIGADTVNYTISVENTGAATAYNLNLADFVPEWLEFDAVGGNSSAESSSFTADSGAQAGTSGTLTWGQISSLAAGETLTYTYSATVLNGVTPGYPLNNIATIAYNSRSDNTGQAWNHSIDTAQDNTAEKTVYVEGLTVSKDMTPDKVTVGDVVTWTITGKVPKGVNAHFPVVEENNLPTGFDYITGTTTVSNASLAPVGDHPINPLDDGNQDLRWFLNSIDNSGSGTEHQFTIEFQTLFTGVKGTDSSKSYFTSNCRNYNKKNTVYVGWYSTANGFENQNQAEDSLSTSYDYKSPAGTATIKLRQPCLTIEKTSQYANVGAGGNFYFELTINNTGEVAAYDVEISDSLPAGLTFSSLNPITITPTPGIAGHSANNEGTSTELAFSINEIPADGTATIRYYVNSATDLSASLDLVNSAKVDTYSTQPGTPADSNSDTLSDERTYSGPTTTKTINTYGISIYKESSHPEELTFGSTIFYTLTVPKDGINAVMYDVTVTDQLPAGMEPVNASFGSFDGNVFSASYAQIDKLEQETIVIEAIIPLTSTLNDGDYLVNGATVTTDQDSKSSNVVEDIISAPALVVEKTSNLFVVAAGDTLSYTVKVKNVGTGTAYNISVTDVLPANQTFLAGEDGQWSIAELTSGQEQTFTFAASVDSATQGVAYTNSVFASGEDSQGNQIPADNSARVPADNDPLDLGKATVYGGPLVCNSEIKNVAFEDLKNQGWSDWDYNDLIVKVETELCFTPPVAPTTRASNITCSDVTIEAESATLAGFAIVADDAASGGQYIHTADSASDFDPSDPNAATSAEFSFNVTTPGRYKFTGIVEGTSIFADSFWFKVDNGETIQWQVPRDGGFVADDVADFVNNIDPFTFDLAVGNHTVTVYQREDGARLDNLTMVCEGTSETYEPNTLATATITYTAGARGSTFNHSLKHTLDTVGGGQASWSLYSSTDALLDSESLSFGDIADFTILPDTMDALPPYYPESYKAQTNTRKEQATYTAGQWAVLSVALDDASSNPKDGLQALPWDVYLPVKDTGEEVHLLVPGHFDNTQAVLSNYDPTSPLLGQSLPLGFSFEDDWHWTTEFEGVWKAYPTYVDFIESGRSENLDWYYLQNSIDWFIWETHFGSDVPFSNQRRTPDITSRYQGTPVVADLSGNGNQQIIVGDVLANEVKVYSNDQTLVWSASTGGGIRGAVAVGNLDGDAQMELVALAEDGKLYGWNHDGSVLAGYPIQIIDGRLLSAPALADIDGDDELEIVISASNGRLYVREADGSAKWNASLGDISDTFGNQSVNSSAVIADIDGDTDLEILVGSFDKCLYAFDHTGNQLWKSCTGDIIVSTPAVGEVAPDSQGSEIIFGSGDGFIYVLNKNGDIYWKRETGNIIQSSPLLADISGNGFNDVIIGSDDDKLHARDFEGNVIAGWPQATAGNIVGQATLGDIDQDGEDEILVGSSDGTVYAFEKDGTLVNPGWPKQTNASIKGSTVIVNIDGDADLEVVAADFKGNLFIWQPEDNIAQIFLPLVGR
ncbi:MAG: LruC domain-containing protein [Anaerolineae bacterium]